MSTISAGKYLAGSITLEVLAWQAAAEENVSVGLYLKLVEKVAF